VITSINKNIISIRCNDWSRKLFDELIPLPDGTTYNSYIVKGSEKVALIDTSDTRTKEEFLKDLRSLNLEKIDYLIVNHAEQDHSGSIPFVIKIYPDIKIITTEKCRDFLFDFDLTDKERVIVVSDEEEVSLGGKTLKFIHTPWVHWPETMTTYLKEDKILFTCDFFGSHFTSNKLFVEDKAKVYEAAKRYYAEIMMPFRTSIEGNLEKIKDIEIDKICPSHGPVYNNPAFIINAYKDWISDKVKNEVVLPFVSMHGSTRKMVEVFIEELSRLDIKVKPFDLSVTDIGEIAMSLVDASTVVVATPTVLTGPHPLALYITYLFGALKPKTRFVSVIGTYSWGGVMLDKIKDLVKNLKVELIEPVIIKGYPKEDNIKKIKILAEKIADSHKKLGLLD